MTDAERSEPADIAGRPRPDMLVALAGDGWVLRRPWSRAKTVMARSGWTVHVTLHGRVSCARDDVAVRLELTPDVADSTAIAMIRRLTNPLTKG